MIALLARLVFQVLALYALVLVGVYFMQRHLQYFPDKNYPGDPKDSDAPSMQVVQLQTEDGLTLHAWFVPPAQRGGKVVVYYHGNAGHLAHRASKVQYFIDKGFGVLLVEYRGFGGNPGSPSEQGLYHDGRAAIKFLEKQNYTVSQLVIYGESIGTGVATQMALEIQPRYLILEAPFSTAADVAKKKYFFLPIDLLMKDRYDSIDKIDKIKTSLLIVHGDEDGVIPIDLGKKLYDKAAHPKEFVTINGGHHSDLYDHHAGYVIVEWLEKQLAVETVISPE